MGFGVAVDFGPLRRHRDFRLLYLARLGSLVGALLTEVAIPFQVYGLTRSSLTVGAVMAVEAVPLLLLAFLGGALADAGDRRRVVILTQLGYLATSLALLGNALGPRSLLALFAIVAVRGALYAFQRPSLEAILPRLLPRGELVSAAALMSLAFNVTGVAAPALSGVLIAAFGLPATYAVDVLSFAASLSLLALLPPVPAPGGGARINLAGIKEGVRYAFSRQELLGTYGVDMVAMFFGMPLALFPALAERMGGAGALGLLYAAPSVGSLLAGAASGWTARVRRQGVAVLLAAAGWGAAIAAFGLAPWLPLALVFLALAGAADTISGIFRVAVWNQTIPDALRGRLAGIEMISYTSGPALSGLESGAVAQLWGPVFSVVSGGAACVIGAALFAAWLPGFRRYLSEPGEEALPVDERPPVVGGGDL